MWNLERTGGYLRFGLGSPPQRNERYRHNSVNLSSAWYYTWEFQWLLKENTLDAD